MLPGGCFCGYLRYEAAGRPFNETCCHCSMCRRSTGAPFVAWFSVRRTDFRLVAGEPTRLRSSAHGTRSFCPRCGTHIIFQSERWPDEIDVNVASLDNPGAIAPKDHIYTSSKLDWLRLCDGLPEFREGRSRT
jgi:hypothetical protein